MPWWNTLGDGLILNQYPDSNWDLRFAFQSQFNYVKHRYCSNHCKENTNLFLDMRVETLRHLIMCVMVQHQVVAAIAWQRAVGLIGSPTKPSSLESQPWQVCLCWVDEILHIDTHIIYHYVSTPNFLAGWYVWCRRWCWAAECEGPETSMDITREGLL